MLLVATPFTIHPHFFEKKELSGTDADADCRCKMHFDLILVVSAANGYFWTFASFGRSEAIRHRDHGFGVKQTRISRLHGLGPSFCPETPQWKLRVHPQIPVATEMERGKKT